MIASILWYVLWATNVKDFIFVLGNDVGYTLVYGRFVGKLYTRQPTSRA